jgi:hypothetical protein
MLFKPYIIKVNFNYTSRSQKGFAKNIKELYTFRTFSSGNSSASHLQEPAAALSVSDNAVPEAVPVLCSCTVFVPEEAGTDYETNEAAS